MLHDFAAAMLVLEPAPGDLILDLGAGACWCSDLLGRLNRPAIAVDISWDMLRAGRSRPGADVRAVAGDLEALPFRSGAFQKAVCLSAVHHVPNIPKALREVARVLDDDGVALFSEPGQGHADAPVSAAAVRDFGVLEQDILIGPFIGHCREAGFEHVTVKPLLQSVPGFDLTLEQWNSWSQLAASGRDAHWPRSPSRRQSSSGSANEDRCSKRRWPSAWCARYVRWSNITRSSLQPRRAGPR